MGTFRNVTWLMPLVVVGLTLAACGDDEAGAAGSAGTGGNGGSAGSAGTGGTGGSGGAGGTAGTGGQPGTLCAKYGGAANVGSVVANNVVPAIAGDCRVNTFFTSLPPAALAHVVECLSIQVQGLFQCPGITYAGAEDSSGVACRSMADAHLNLGISDGDFNALLDDVVAGLTEAGVEEADINAAAPALIGMHDDIVEDDGNTGPTQSICDADAGL